MARYAALVLALTAGGAVAFSRGGAERRSARPTQRGAPPPPTQWTAPIARCLCAPRAPQRPLVATMAATEDSSTDAWRVPLDALPVFAVANGAEGDDAAAAKKPIAYTVNGRSRAIFHADVGAAKQAWEAACAANPALLGKIDVATFGLGAAVALVGEGKALIAPGAAELAAAGMPDGVSPLGQELPLFACMGLARPPAAEGGGSVLPLFMSHADCQAAVAEAEAARAAGDAAAAPLEISPLSVGSVVDHLTAAAAAAAEQEGEAAAAPPLTEFELIPPSASTQHLSSYVGNGVYARVVDEEKEG